MPAQKTSEKPFSRKRELFFKAFSILIPLVFLVLSEIALVFFDYGHDLSLFIDDPKQKDYLVMNPFVSGRYFTRSENATVGDSEPFKKQKASGTFRIFVLGESTTIGYPYMYNGSFHRWLKYRLMHSFPDKEFEIINLSLTAVNSHTVLDFSDEIVDYQPDAVMVYTGHNEYYGALGVGSTSFAGTHPALIRLVVKSRRLRTVQLITNIYNQVKGSISQDKTDLRENLMKRMVSDQKIPLHSKRYQEGIEKFTRNMTDLCQLFSQSKIPVFISTLVSNEKDLKPFISESGPAEGSALYHFQLGSRAYEAGKFEVAEKYFASARELDLLRFRAPEALNAIIKDLAARYPVVKLVDAREVFKAHSPHGILGKETLLEHVHPNLFGYALLSDAFYKSLYASGLIPTTQDAMSFDALRQQMPVTTVDSLKGAYEMMILKEGWPFNEPMPAEEQRPKTLEEQLAGALVVRQISWRQAMEQLLLFEVKNKDQRKALKVTEALLLEYPQEIAWYEQAAKRSLTLNENRKAVVYLKKAFRMENNFERARMLFVTLLKMDKPEEALTYIQYAAAHNSSQFSLDQLLAFVSQLVMDKQAYQKDTTNANLSNQVAAGYLRFANTAAATVYLEKTLRMDPGNEAALQMKKQIGAIQK